MRIRWETFYSPLTKLEYKQSEVPVNNRLAFLATLPPNAIPCEESEIPSSSIILPVLSEHEPTTFEEFIATLADWEQELLGNLTLLPGTTWEQIITALLHSDIVFASDGSVANNIGTFGWVMALQSTGIRLLENLG